MKSLQQKLIEKSKQAVQANSELEKKIKIRFEGENKEISIDIAVKSSKIPEIDDQEKRTEEDRLRSVIFLQEYWRFAKKKKTKTEQI